VVRFYPLKIVDYKKKKVTKKEKGNNSSIIK
jgi:hypothetical protein